MSFSEVYCLGIDMKELVAQSCLTICHPIDCSPPGFSVHGILLVRILEWVEDPGIFPTHGLNPGVLHCRRILYHLSQQGSLGIDMSRLKNRLYEPRKVRM